jgi:hypothetical protein
MRSSFKIVAVAIGMITLLWLTLYYGPVYLAVASTTPPEADRWQAVSNARTALVQLLIGSGAVIGGVVAARSLGLTRQSQRNDRFAKAVEHLGNDSSEALRSGGVHTLHLLADEWSSYWPILDDVLTTFIRERLQDRKAIDPAVVTTKYRDVQAALTVLGRRPSGQPGSLPRPLHLYHLDLRGFDLSNANFERADLRGAKLHKANLVDAVLQDAIAVETEFNGADLSGATLSCATLTGAVFANANLFNTKLDGADVAGAELGHARNVDKEELAQTHGTPASQPW